MVAIITLFLHDSLLDYNDITLVILLLLCLLSECYHVEEDITNGQVTVSSGNGNGLDGNAWKPASSDNNPSISVSFPVTTEIHGLVLTGSNKKYFEKVKIKYSQNGVVQTVYSQSGVVSIHTFA